MLMKVLTIVFSNCILVLLTGDRSFSCIMITQFHNPFLHLKAISDNSCYKKGHVITGIDSAVPFQPSTLP